MTLVTITTMVVPVTSSGWKAHLLHLGAGLRQEFLLACQSFSVFCRQIEAQAMNWWTKTVEFLSEVRTEMRKVSFPARDEVVSTTIVVIVTSVVFGRFCSWRTG